jgi:hypothetical protein
MPTTNRKITVPSSEGVRNEAVRMLIKRMGITKAAIFIRETMAQKTDYLETKRELFRDKSAAELYKEIKDN